MSVYDVITERICSLLEQGVCPWRRPWSGGGLPANLVSGKEYQGLNQLFLACAPYSSRWWVTYRQAKELGGHVKKGEKGYPVVYWSPDKIKKVVKEDGEEKTTYVDRPILRYYTVFNLEQTEGVRVPKGRDLAEERNFPPIEEADRLIFGWEDRPTIRHEGGQAYYRPADDLVVTPKPETFDSEDAFYNTLFHELIHSTGHSKRLNRPTIGAANAGFGSPGYAKEELLAELGAAFLCAHCGIDQDLPNNAAYLQSWINALKGDKILLVKAASQAKKATEYILNHQEDGGPQGPAPSPDAPKKTTHKKAEDTTPKQTNQKAVDVRKPSRAQLGLTKRYCLWSTATYKGKTVWIDGHTALLEKPAYKDFDQLKLWDRGNPSLDNVVDTAKKTCTVPLPDPAFEFDNRGEPAVIFEVQEGSICLPKYEYSYLATQGGPLLYDPNSFEENIYLGPVFCEKAGNPFGVLMPIKISYQAACYRLEATEATKKLGGSWKIEYYPVDEEFVAYQGEQWVDYIPKTNLPEFVEAKQLETKLGNEGWWHISIHENREPRGGYVLFTKTTDIRFDTLEELEQYVRENVEKEV